VRWPLPVVVSLLAPALVAAQQPSFRARTELVRLDVLVTDDGMPVADLTAADFEVKDNGVAQRVTAVGAIEAVQLAVVLDTSGSMTGDRLDLARAATTELLHELTPRDSVAVLAFGSQTGRIAARGTSVHAALAALGRLTAAGSTSLVDGLYAGILEAGHEPGPKLVLMMTDGRNNSSWLKGADVIDIARRHGAVVYPVAVGLIDGMKDTARPRGGNPLPVPMSADRAWRAEVNPSFRTNDSLALLRVIADETGGRPIQADWNRELGSVFRRILDEYRQRYILSFTPEGVGTREGWHTLDVRVKRRGATVRSRTRYWSD
jgi:VWFA-related protein